MLAGTPRVTQLNPVSGRQAQTLDVTITGQFTNFVQGTDHWRLRRGDRDDGRGQVQSPTSAIATIAIQPTAALGVRSVTVTTGGEVAPSSIGFAVTPGQPAIASVTPNSGVQGRA